MREVAAVEVAPEAPLDGARHPEAVAAPLAGVVEAGDSDLVRAVAAAQLARLPDAGAAIAALAAHAATLLNRAETDMTDPALAVQADFADELAGSW